MEQLRQAELLHPRVSLWTMDEHRTLLKPILRRVWAPTGQPLICPVQPRYEWLYIFLTRTAPVLGRTAPLWGLPA